MSGIFSILSLLISVGVFFAYINPMWTGTIADAKNAIELDNQALAAANQYKAQQDTLASARAAIDSLNLDRLEKLLPDSVDNVGLILDLNALAARSGLSLANIDVVMSDSNTGSDFVNQTGSVSLSLSAIGTFDALQTFLIGVERSARLLDIQDITVKGSDTGIYTYQMTIRLYWLR